ncbi:MAG TPA: transglycosylase SLT domain-containing protein [Trueperaceae bacterium]|nr:transglycosylase SLT domain-containing protein [Trueperaceae bacterium]
MIPFPGLMAMPTVLLNAGLNLVRERGSVALGPDRLAVVAPMYDEEAGAERALRSILAQTEPFDELLVSINGGTDATPDVVAATLSDCGFSVWSEASDTASSMRRWRKEGSPTAVSVVEYRAPVSKARSVNLLLERGLLAAERVLIVDGDTELHPGFAAAARRALYRLAFERLPGGRHGYVLEDASLVSGAVRSLPGASLQSRLISAGRDAEYAFSAIVRGGQCRRVGHGAVFGRSRLFTVVGCGFVARRDVLPVPDDTVTEDHDLTLAAQNGPVSEELATAAELDRRGFRLEVNGRERPLSHIIGPDTPVVLRRGANARFVPSALMRTEDPPHLGGFLRQVERWNGGGIENALKRLGVRERRRTLEPHVAFTVGAAQAENLLGLFLALLLPALLGLRYALPNASMPAAALAAWLGVDALASLVIVVAGARRLGDPWGRAVWVALRGTVPLLLLRGLNALAYVTALTRVVPAFVRQRRAARVGRAQAEVVTTWVRPRANLGAAAHARAAGVATVTVALGLTVFTGTAHVARAYLRPSEAWTYIHAVSRLDQSDFEILPLPAVAVAPEPSLEEPAAEPASWLSPYCAPSVVGGYAELVAAGAEPPQRRLDTAVVYEPLTPWGLQMLARLAPLLAHIEEAATAYDLDAGFLLQVLINESYLDPLAHGPTNDIGLSQVTSDALTLLAAISAEAGSPFENRALFARRASAYDPEFSVCAGAAKLAWSVSQPHGSDRGVAYARYINPLDGVRDGAVAPTHVAPVTAMMKLGSFVDRLAAVVVAYRADREAVTDLERALLDVSSAVAAGEVDLEGAYALVGSLVAQHGIDDAPFYASVLERLYGAGLAAQEGDLRAAAPAWP